MSHGLWFKWRPEYAHQTHPQVIDGEVVETCLKPTSLTPTDISKMSYYDEMARHLVRQAAAEQAKKESMT